MALITRPAEPAGEHKAKATAPAVVQFDAVPLLTVYLGLLTMIPARWVVPGMGSAGRPASVFAIGLLALWGLIQLLPNVETKKSKLRWPLLLNAIVLVFSYGLGYDRGLTDVAALSADRALLIMLSVSGLMLMTCEGLPTLDHVSKFTRRLTYFAGFLAFVGLVQFITKFDPYSVIKFPGLSANKGASELGFRGRGAFVRVRSSTLHPIEFAVVMALALPLALHHAIHEPIQLFRRRRYALAGLILATSMFAVSRSAIVGLVAAGLMMFWAWSPRMRVRVMGAGMVGVIAMQGVVPGLLGTIKSLFLNWGTDNSITGRTDDYDIIRRYVAERPWFGRGTGSFIPEEYITLDNAYLKRLVATGFIGLATVVFLLLFALFAARHVANRGPSNTIRHMGASLVAMVLVGILSAGTFSLFFFPTAAGFTHVAIGLSLSLLIARPDDPFLNRAEPEGILRMSYQVGYKRKPWWHRFDPELNDHA